MRTIIVILLGLLLWKCTPKEETPFNIQKGKVHHIDSLLDVSFSLLRKNPNTALQLARKAHSLAQEYTYSKGQARSLRSQAYAHNFTGDFATALQCLKTAENLEKQAQNYKGLAAVYNIRATVFKTADLYQEAIVSYRHALNIKDSVITPTQIVRYHNNIANAFAWVSAYDSAIVYYQRTLDSPVVKNDTASLASIHTNIGNVYSLLQDYEKARSYYLRALSYSTQKDIPVQTAKIYNNLGALHYDLNQDSTALHYFNKSLAVRQQLQDSLALAKSYFNLGKLYSQRPDKKQLSSTYLEQASTIFKTFNAHKDLVRVYLVQADNQLLSGKPELAILILKQAEKLIKASDDISIENKIYKKMAEALQRTGRYKEALANYTKYETLRDSVLNADKRLAVAELEKKHQLQIKQKEISLLHKDRDLANIQIAKEQAENNTLQVVLGAILIIAILLSFLVFYFYRLKKTTTRMAVQSDQLHQERIRNLVNDQEIKIINATLTGREKEKSTISKELHDNVGSLLTAIKFHLNAFNTPLLFSHEATKSLYHKVQHITDTVIDEVRSFSHRLDRESLTEFNLKEAIIAFSKKIENKNLKVKTAIYGLDAVIHSRVSILIFRILQELINNTIKHAQANELYINLTRHHDHISIRVEDNGKGFDPSRHNEGIGLKNLRAQISNIQGKFQLDTWKQGGTIAHNNHTFTLMKPIRILVCDDHILVAEGIELMLQQEPEIYVAQLVTSGKAAIAYLETSSHIDLLILDVSMPDMDGIQVLEHIQLIRHPVPVLILTMHEQLAMVKTALQKGAQGYLLKNASKEKLLHAIKKIAGGGSYFDDTLALGLIKHLKGTKVADAPSTKLTPREIEVLKLMVRDKKTNEIASLCFISVNTVLTHKKNIYSKLNIHSVAELVHYAYKNNYLDA